ncbi:hypothetical protein ACKWTF_001070 [Chironomus riparius]
MVINITIAASWKVAQDRHQKLAISAPTIYNSVSGNSNPLKIKNYFYFLRDAGRRNPTNMMSWYPQTRLYKTKFSNDIDIFWTHFIPAFLSDSYAKMKGENGK